MRVRTATRDDIAAFRRLAHTATGETDLAFAPSLPSAVVKRCVLAGTVLVAEGDDGHALGYAVAQRKPDHALLRCAIAEQGERTSDIITALVAAIRRAMPTVPCATQSILGDTDRERVLEAGGFVPGEVEPLERNGFGFVSRRWWADALWQET